MVRPGVELQPLLLGEKPRERARRNRPADPGERLVAAARGRLADRDLRGRVAGLDPGVRGAVELRVVRGADDLLAGELGRQEELDVRLVPHRPKADDAVAG